MLDYEAIWEFSRKKGEECAADMWPPDAIKERRRAADEIAHREYFQRTTPHPPQR